MRYIAVAFLLVAACVSAQTTAADLRKAIVDTALGLRGVPYVYGAESPPDALDCSGFVQYVFRKAAGLDIPRNSRQQWESGYPIEPSQVRPGDVFVFNTSGSGPSHVALYIGNGSMIQAASEGPQTGVIVSSTSERYWAQRLIGARSFLDKPSPAAAVPAPTAPASSAPATSAAQAAAARPPAAGAPPSAALAAAPTVTAPSTAAAAAPPTAAPAGAAPGGTREEAAVSEIGFALGAQPSVLTDRIPTAAGSLVAFTINNETGKSGAFLIDFYKADADFSKIVPLKHLTVTIAAGGHYRIDPYLFDEPGRYRLNVKTAGNLQLMQRSFEVVQIGRGGAIQAYTGKSESAAALPKGIAITKVGLVVGGAEEGSTLKAAKGSAMAFRVANGTGTERVFAFVLYRLASANAATGGGQQPILLEQRARLPAGAWIELPPVLLAEEGSYRFVVKSGENDLLLQRTIVVGAGGP